MEDWSYEEQISYTSRASVLLSLHGAGLTHMLFMPKGSKVIEIRLDGDSLNNCYFSMASGLDHDYFYIYSTLFDQQLNLRHYEIIIQLNI